ncbi:SDR family NAD(P)-dependent oxidoreductase [Streptomyces sp. NPDC042319]|uniref:SDR family NAD(P)-dependent oxidoreductase n=1 Tax=Streptomyces sp. NPDC042319 TaxID=3154332 RepID=UPI0033D55806
MLITDATSGVGVATARFYAERGAAVVALRGRRAEELSRVADEIGDRAHTLRTDASDAESATRMRCAQQWELGGRDVAVNAADLTKAASLEKLDDTLRRPTAPFRPAPA